MKSFPVNNSSPMSTEKEFKVVSISHSPDLPSIITQKFEKKGCIYNSYETSKYTNELMVEGILTVFVFGEVANMVWHCWNRNHATGEYYDVTKDYVWSSDSFKNEHQKKGLENITYEYIACFEYGSSDCNINESILDFKYNGTDILNNTCWMN